MTANDFLTHNEVDDDRYSLAVGLTLRLGRYDVRFYENAFTDRANALRFDETWLRVGRPLPGPGRWRVYAEAGGFASVRGCSARASRTPSTARSAPSSVVRPAPIFLEFANWIEGQGALGPVIFIVGYTLATIIPVPGAVLNMLAGAIFGLAWGTLWVFCAATLGSAAAFLIAR